VARNLISYLQGQINQLRDNEEVLVHGDHEYGEKKDDFKMNYEWFDKMQSMQHNYVVTWENILPDEVVKNTDFSNTLNLYAKTPRSWFTHAAYYATMKSYDDSHEIEDFDLYSGTKSFYFKHIQTTYGVGFRMLTSIDVERQKTFMLKGIISGTSTGWDLWQSQDKDKFPEIFTKFCKVHLGIKVKFTPHGVLDAIDKAIALKFYPPFTGFSRTQGGSRKKVRVVYGGNILAKAAGALLNACKELAGIRLSKVGKWKWLAWEDWDLMFSSIVSTWNKYVNKEGFNLVGEDFTGWDTRLHWRHFEFLMDMKGPLASIWIWVLGLMRYSEVWTGVHKIDDIYFVSGHPLTQELGSIKHYDLTMASSKQNKYSVEAGIFLSDDNLLIVKDYDLEEHAKTMSDLGFALNEKKSTDYWRDGYAEFLKNWIVYSKIHEKLIAIGNPFSRMSSLCYDERIKDQASLWKVTGDFAVDKTISKLASYGKDGGAVVSLILQEQRETSLGRKVIEAIPQIPDKVEAYRPDIPAGYRPQWLKDIFSVPKVGDSSYF
jgi:hypothetical protein